MKAFVESTELDAFFFLDSSCEFHLLMELTSKILTCQLTQALSAFFSVHNWWLITKALSIPLFIYNKQPFQVWFEDDDNYDDDDDDYDDDDEDDDYDDDDEDNYDDNDYDDDYDDEDDDEYDDDYDGDDGQFWIPPLPSTSHR